MFETIALTFGIIIMTLGSAGITIGLLALIFNWMMFYVLDCVSVIQHKLYLNRIKKNENNTKKS
jgi:membrane protein implicated in regulation of membrane protease activity